MVRQQAGLLFRFRNFKQEFVNASGVKEVNIPEFLSPSIYQFILKTKVNDDLLEFGNSAGKVNVPSDEQCLQTVEDLPEIVRCPDKNSDVFLSVTFNVQRKMKMKNLYEIFSCAVSVIDASGQRKFTQSFSANLDCIPTQRDGITVSVGFSDYIKCSKLIEQEEELLHENTLCILCDLALDWCDKRTLQYNRDFTMEEWLAISEMLYLDLHGTERASLSMNTINDKREKQYNFEKSIWEHLGYVSVPDDIPLGDFDLNPWKEQLCRTSPYFERMFSSEYSESLSGIIFIPRREDLYYTKLIYAVEHNTLDHILDMDTHVRLYILADKYLLLAVKEMCVDHIMNHIDVENVVPILMLANKYREEQLKKRAVGFILEHWENVIEAYGWKELKEFEPSLYEELSALHQEGEKNESLFFSEEKKETKSNFPTESQLAIESNWTSDFELGESFDFYT